jgi:hypothetical protein
MVLMVGNQVVSNNENSLGLHSMGSAPSLTVLPETADDNVRPLISGRKGSTVSRDSCSTCICQSTLADSATADRKDHDLHSVGDKEPTGCEGPTRMKLALEDSPINQPQHVLELHSENHDVARMNLTAVPDTVQTSFHRSSHSLGEEGEEEAVDQQIVASMESLKIAPTAPGESGDCTPTPSLVPTASAAVLEFMADSDDFLVPTSVQIHRARAPRAASRCSRTSEGGAPRRQVSFHQVQIRRYPMVAGDNPSCQIGTPVTLDWGFEELPALDLDDFELTRTLTRRRKMHHLILNYFQRRRILSGMGFSDEDIDRTEKEINRERLKRSLTRMLLPISKIEEIIQSLCRKVKRRMSKDIRTAKQELDSSIESLRKKDAEGYLERSSRSQ